MTAKLFGDLVPHGRCDAAAQVQLVVGVPNLWILLDGLQQLCAIHERILLWHGDRIWLRMRYMFVELEAITAKAKAKAAAAAMAADAEHNCVL